MKSLIYAFALVLSFGSAMAMADIVCPGFVTILPNGDEALITYAAETGFADLNDTASLVIVDGDETLYRTNKWGATFGVPNDLIYGKASAGHLTVYQAEKASRTVLCYGN